MTRWLLACWLFAGGIGLAPSVQAEESIELSGGEGNPITVVVREAPIAEVFEMLSRRERVNILVADGVEGSVSANLFDVSLDQAIRAIADSAGYVAERRHGSYVIIEREEAGKDSANGNTIVRAFRVQYSDPKKVSEIASKHLSRYGEVDVLEDRRLLVVEDLPDFVRRIGRLLEEIDREPRQILFEAKILEVTLNDNETYGINWSQLLGDGETGDIGVQGLSALGTAGFFFDYVKLDNLEVALNALSEQGRTRTLSTPTLLALEYEEAEVVVGDRLGFRVTTTINQVTTESVEFLESGVILKLKAWVDRENRILLEVHPEVSTGVINDGIPNQTTAEVTTTLLAENGQTIFIGGLIKDRLTENHSGAPFLKDIPILGWLVSKREQISVRTETIVVISARLANPGGRPDDERLKRLGDIEEQLGEKALAIDRKFGPAEPTEPPTAAPSP